MAEGFFIDQLNKNHSSIEVNSAGINALVNHSPETYAQEVMKKHGIDISNHLARQLTESIVQKAGLILVMTQNHLKTVIDQFLSAKGKTFLLGHWRNMEIKDPFLQSYETFEKIYQQIELAWQDWRIRILACQNVCV